jgi:hypothetical protein
MIEVLNIIINGFVFPTDPLTFLTHHPTQILGFKDFGRLACCCKALNTFIKSITYMRYHVTVADYELYTIIQKHRGETLYYLSDPGHVWRFLELFGYVHVPAHPTMWESYYCSWYDSQRDLDPVHWLCYTNEHKAATALIHYNPDLLHKLDGNGWDLFNMSARYSYNTMLFILDNYHVDVNNLLTGFTPLQNAIGTCNHYAAVELLKRCADPNKLSDRGLHVIFYIYGCTQCIWILLNSRIKIDFNVTDTRGCTVIEHFKQYVNHPERYEIIHILRENVPDIR